jgi:hypothetical protein
MIVANCVSKMIGRSMDKTMSGATTGSEPARLDVAASARHAAYRRLRAFRGSEAQASDAPRRREPLVMANVRRRPSKEERR